jgi:RNA polymerase sigma-70 factor (ECF subfamily)
LNEIAAIQKGDETVFELVYERHHEKLYFYILKKTSSAYIAEEVVQLAFIKLWTYRRSLSFEVPLEAQIFRIARTSLIDLLRKNANQRSLLENYKDIVPVEGENVMSSLMKKEMSERISSLIEEMPAVRKKVFKLSREGGLSNKEIAEQLSLTPKNVENHISKAIKQIKKALLIFCQLLLLFLQIIIFVKNIF